MSETVTSPATDDGAQGTDGHRTRVPVPVARFDDPHLQDAARHPKRVENIVAVFFLLGIVGVAGFGAAYWVNAKPLVLALTFGAGLFCLGFGLTAWGKYLMPQGPFVEERHVLRSNDEERAAMSAALVQRTDVVVRRRKVLGGLLGVGFGIFGIVAIFPLLRSLGPVPGDSYDTTNWRRNSLLVDSNGRPIHVDDLRPGGIVTVFPDGYQDTDEGQSYDQTVLIRVQVTPLYTVSNPHGLPPDQLLPAGRETWTPAGYVAYSKMCTHLGCPVGLYEQLLELLVCPCHQSMFNVRNGAIPQFGPAPRPLPQLPLQLDANGYLHAQSGYDQAVGPGYWERTPQGNSTA